MGQAGTEKQRVALGSLFAAAFLTATKVIVGILTNSLGILAEAAHSGLDLVAAAATLWAVNASSKPADREHTYGHGKFENLSALFQMFLLVFTCAWIIYEAVGRLRSDEPAEVDAGTWAFAVVIVSVAVDFTRSRALRRAAVKHRSQALEADALHFSTDIYSSLVVLVGLAGVVAAQRGFAPFLVYADSVAALAVAIMVAVLSLKLGRKSVDDLLDAVPSELLGAVEQAACRVSGVQEVRSARVRRSGPVFFADITISVVPDLPLARSHEIADSVEAAVSQVLPAADVTVHVEPADDCR